MKSKKLIVLLFGSVLSLGFLLQFQQPGSAADKRVVAQKSFDNDSVQQFMRAKLKSAQDVIEGLVTEDFDLIKRGAKNMHVMSKATEWKIIHGPVYTQYSAEFRRAAEQLMKMADKKNIDGAALSYVQLTLNCISCHKYVRSVKVANLDDVPDLEKTLSSLPQRDTKTPPSIRGGLVAQ